LDRLEQVVTVLAESHLSLEKVVADLATETRRGFDQVAAQFEVIGKRMDETDRRFRETDERFRETDERSRRTDERIDKLVSAIGELIRNQNAPRA